MKTFHLSSCTALTLSFAVLTAGYAPRLNGDELHSAARKGDTAEVKKLLDEGADINAISAGLLAPRMTPLMEAAMNGHVDTLALLLDRGARLDMTAGRGSDEMTALMFAASRGQAGAVKLMIERGANLHAVSLARHSLLTAARSGMTAQQWAQKTGQDECAALLAQAERDEPMKLLAAQKAAQQAAERANREQALGRHPDPAARDAAEKAAETALQAGKLDEALVQFTAAIHASPPGSETDERLRERAIQVSLAMTPPPPLPETATHHALRGKAFVELAQDEAGYNKALTELEQAVEIAPWFADAYFNLGLIEEKVNKFSAAIRHLNLYLLAAPGSPDAPAVRQKIIKLEVKQELKDGK